MSETDVKVEKLSFKDKVKVNAKNCLKDIHKREIIILILCSLGINFVVETLALLKYDGILGAIYKLFPVFSGAGSKEFAGFLELFTDPLKVFQNILIFLYNSSIVMVLLSFAFLFKRRYFAMTVFSAIWLVFGIANFVILSYRVTPFSAVELQLIDAAMGVMKSYVTGSTFVIVALAVLLGVGSLIFVWRRTKKFEKINRFSGVVIIGVVFLGVVAATFGGIKSGVVASKLPNLSVDYQKYGFVYCFVSSFNTGIGKPNDYSEGTVKKIQTDTKHKLEGVTGTGVGAEGASKDVVTVITKDSVTAHKVDDSKLPNVIFLQLESFFDITVLDGLQLSEDPIPTFRNCMQKYSSGYLTVPSVGAGTANTEFEIMTGMNLDFFGPGEYPYKTILKDKSCETTAYNLKNHGFTAHAIHNNRANFYSRNSVFRRFGYDYFTTIELMDIQEYTENGWAKDKVLTGEIINSMKATPTKDYIYTISVQGHGEYPETEPLEEPKILVTGGIEDVAAKNRIQYYVNQLKEMDDFIKELMEELNKFGEKTILVAYGDHLPNLDFGEEDLTKGNMFQTQYFVWNNIDLDVMKEDVEAYQLSAKVMDSIDVTDGAVNAYHQANWGIKDSEEYLKDLEILGYDMLYGDSNVTEGKVIYEPTKIKYGVDNVQVTGAYRDYSDTDYLVIKGKHFTEYSAVFVNGEKYEPEFLNQNTLRVPLSKQTQDVKIVVKQCYKEKLVLQTSNEIVYESINEANVYDDGDEPVQSKEPKEEDLGELIEDELAVQEEEELNQQE